jgi:hypothetical protein
MRCRDQLGEAIRQRRRDTLIDRPLDQDAAAGRAGLAAVLDHRVHQHRQRRLDIGGREDDLRRLPPSSIVTPRLLMAAACWIAVPVGGEPVKVT